MPTQSNRTLGERDDKAATRDKNAERVRNPQDNKTDWEEILADWKKSGQSQSVFCKSRKLKYNTFVYHRMKQLKKSSATKKFKPLQVNKNHTQSESTDRSFTLCLSDGAKLLIPQEYNQDALKELLNILGVYS